MNKKEKKILLGKISSEYLSGIPEALLSIDAERKLYGAIVPHFGWDFEIEDRVHWSTLLWTLDTAYAKLVTDAIDSEPAEEPIEPADEDDEFGMFGFEPKPKLARLFDRLFEIENHVDRQPIQIRSQKLDELMGQWYAYQDEIGHGQELVDELGEAIASACRKLNAGGWHNDRLSEDFVLYTDCCGDENTNFGLAECANQTWKAAMESEYEISIRDVTSRPT